MTPTPTPSETPTPTPTPTPGGTAVPKDNYKARYTAEGRIYSRRWLVTLADPGDSPEYNTINCDGLPRIGNPHDEDPGAYVSNLETEETKRLDTWYVNVTWETPKSTIPVANPLLEIPDISWTFREFTHIVTKDADDNPIMNSAFDYLAPPLEEIRGALQVRIVVNQSSYNPVTALAYMERPTVNSDTCEIVTLEVAPRQALMRQFSGDRKYRNGITYYPTTYLIEFDPNEFTRQLVDQGLNRLTANDDKDPINRGGHVIQEPVRLDGSGQPLPDNADLDATVWIDVDTAQELPFGGLGLALDW